VTPGHGERDGQLLIDSAIEITKRGDGAPDTVEMIDKLRQVRSPYGPWMCGLGPELVSPDRISWWWKRARQVSGIDAKWRLHDLRHWSATVAIGQGHDVRTVAGRLGHANPAMTLRVYAHAFAAADQAVAAGLGEILKGGGK
jgi:integrase